MRKMYAFGLMAVTALSALVSCQQIETPAAQTADYSFTVKAVKGDAQATKALSVVTSDEGRKYLDAYFTTRDRVYVYKNPSDDYCEGFLAPDREGDEVNLTGRLSGQEIKENDRLILSYNNKQLDYTGQTGELQVLAENYDYAKAEVDVASVVDGRITAASAAVFENQQAIVKFIFKDKAGERVYPTSLTIDAKDQDGNSYIQLKDVNERGALTLQSINPENTADGVYVAIRMIADSDFRPVQSMTISAEDADFTYDYTREGRVSFSNGRYYEITVTLNSTYKGTGKPLAQVTADNTGWVIAADGQTYSPAVARRIGIDGKAVVLYAPAQGQTNTINKVLCVAWEDASAQAGTYKDAVLAVSAWNSDESHRIAGYEWIVPSNEDWRDVWLCDVTGVEEGWAYHAHEKLANAGAAELKGDAFYWSSTVGRDITYDEYDGHQEMGAEISGTRFIWNWDTVHGDHFIYELAYRYETQSGYVRPFIVF